METIALLGTVMGLSFTAGINLYATIVAVGMGMRLGLITLAPELEPLSILAEPVVLFSAGGMYLLEFFADKVPGLDHTWDSIHTFIRPIGAALIGAQALGQVDPALELTAALLCGGVAFTSHTTKAGTRLLINASPEPISNSVASVLEDGVAIGGTYMALVHPYVMLGFVGVFVIGFLIFGPRLLRAVNVQMRAVLAAIGSFLGRRGANLEWDTPPEALGQLLGTASAADGAEGEFCMRVASSRGVDLGRNHIGYLRLSGDALRFATRKWFRPKMTEITLKPFHEVRLERRWRGNWIVISGPAGATRFRVFRDAHRRAQVAADLIHARINAGAIEGASTPALEPHSA